MSVFRIGDIWRERGKRGRAVLVQAIVWDRVEATFLDSKKTVRIAARTLMKYFNWDAR